MEATLASEGCCRKDSEVVPGISWRRRYDSIYRSTDKRIFWIDMMEETYQKRKKQKEEAI